MELKNYETVFIVTPVLSDAQIKDTVVKFENFLKEKGAEIINVENWGLRKLAYPIQHKTTGFYSLVEFKATPDTIAAFETEFRRDETVLRFLTTAMDKHAVAYAEKRRAGKFNKKENKEEAK
ncbi:MAG: 30S ribosomal protein S6 [Cytophagales bacterium]|nr:30S ribosomal protein S6 [Cytophagales bacterium]